MLKSRYEKLEHAIGITFKNLEICDLAFVHKSYLNEHSRLKPNHNERLEFLGDAVLELVTTEFLYKTYPNLDEGKLTKFRSALVKGNHLAEVSIELGLGIYLYLSRGEERSGGRSKNYILANALEALIGSIYLDSGYETTKEFIDRFILTKVKDIVEQGLHIDPKSKFQEQSQEIYGITPIYKVLGESGPDHAKVYTVAVHIGEKAIAEGQGSSKQRAESAAAETGLKVMNW